MKSKIIKKNVIFFKIRLQLLLLLYLVNDAQKTEKIEFPLTQTQPKIKLLNRQDSKYINQTIFTSDFHVYMFLKRKKKNFN